MTPAVVFGALIRAMFWNVVTWLKGIPSSSSHALVGGIVGAGVAHAGVPSIQWIGLNDTLIAIVLSPMLGLILTMAIMLVTSWLGLRASARGAERMFRGLHLVSAGAYSLGHGLNDAQKTMGVISVLLYSPASVRRIPRARLGRPELLHRDGSRYAERRVAHHRDDGHPHHQAVAAPGLLGVGRRVDHALRRFVSRHPGFDDAYDHGLRDWAGAARRASAVRWGIAGNVAVAWLITIPASLLVAALFYWLVSGFYLRVAVIIGLIAFVTYSARAWRLQS